MVSFKLIGTLVAVTCLLTTSQAASTKKSAQRERIAALYVKDSSNGELRFLGGGISSNAELNQLITQKQEMLEQLRPTTNTGTGNWGTGTGTLTGTGTGTGNLGVTPIVINAGAGGVGGGGGGGAVGGGNGGGSNGAINSVINGASPIGDLLPQIIAQATVTRSGGGGNRRRVVNNRRRRRRPNRGGNRPQIFLVRSRN